MIQDKEFFKEIKKEAERIIHSKLENKEVYLTSFMTQIKEKEEKPKWLLHFYNQIEDNMYTYDYETKELKGPEEVFKEEEFVPELLLEEINISYEKSIEKAFENALPEKEFLKIIVLLQTIEEKPVWNFTFMNKTYHALNVRIDATNGNIIKKEAFELFSFGNNKKEE